MMAVRMNLTLKVELAFLCSGASTCFSREEGHSLLYYISIRRGEEAGFKRIITAVKMLHV